MVLKLMAAIVAAGSLACATMDHGRTQQIQVDSHPTGATVTLSHCGSGSSKPLSTPATVTVSRRATHCQLTLDLPHHDPRTIQLRRHLTHDLHEYLTIPLDVCGEDVGNCDSAEALAAGLIIWGIVATVGITVDTSTAAIFEEIPRAVAVDFESGEEPAPQTERR